MTVDELIDKLAKYPGDWEVLCDDSEFGADVATYVIHGRWTKGSGGKFESWKPGVMPNAVKIS